MGYIGLCLSEPRDMSSHGPWCSARCMHVLGVSCTSAGLWEGCMHVLRVSYTSAYGTVEMSSSVRIMLSSSGSSAPRVGGRVRVRMSICTI